MDPQVLMQLSQLIQQLPPDQLSKMQTLMHNAMAGFDVRSQMEDFERNLPPGFREKLVTLIASNPAAFAPAMAGANSAMSAASAPSYSSSTSSPSAKEVSPSGDSAEPMDMREARLTVLRGVASGQVSPEEAEKLLFT